MDKYMENYAIAVLIILISLAVSVFALFIEKAKCTEGSARGLTSKELLSVEDKSIYAILMIVLGTVFGRVYYYVFDMTNVEATFFGVQGKISLYGVLFGIAIATLLMKIIKKKSVITLIEMVVVPGLIMLIGTRISDFFLGSNYGRVIENEAFMKFPFGVYIKYNVGGAWLTAVFVYELIAAIGMFIFSVIVKRKKAIYILGMYSLVRVVTESLRQDALYIGFVKISQVLALVLGIFALIYYMVKLYRNNQMSIKRLIVYSVIALTMVVIGFLCEFFMGTEVEKLFTLIITVCMLVVAIILTIVWHKAESIAAKQ